MDIDLIRRLVELLKDTDVTELFCEEEGRTIRIRRGGTAAVPASSAQVEEMPSPPTDGAAYTTNVVVKSPMVGTFYRAPNPDSEPFVRLGDRVRKGQVVCVIEAMKLMNEIESEFDGIVRELLVENGQPVEYAEPLMVLEPV